MYFFCYYNNTDIFTQFFKSSFQVFKRNHKTLEKILLHFEHHTATVELGLVTSSGTTNKTRY